MSSAPHLDGMIVDCLPNLAAFYASAGAAVQDIIGYSGPADNQRPITSKRSVETQVRLGDAETAVLGGLLKENDIEIERRIADRSHDPHHAAHRTVGKEEGRSGSPTGLPYDGAEGGPARPCGCDGGS